MHKFTIRRWIQLLLVGGLCLGTLATSGAVSQEEPVSPPETGLSLSQEVKTGTAAPEPAAGPSVEEPAAQTPEQALQAAKEAESRRRRASGLLARYGLTREQRETLSARMGADAALFQKLEGGELSRAELAWLGLPNARPDRLDRYDAWMEAHPEDSRENAVLQVNIDQDQPFYSLIWETADPDSLSVLVNKHYTLPAGYVPELEALGKGYGSGSLRPEAAQAFRTMADAAKKDGIALRSVSAYRSYKTQNSTYNRYLKQYRQATVDTFSARPGHSEHQTGLALDINVASTRAHFERTPAFAWLKEHCAEYGFILRYDQGKEALTGYRFEPWHYRYVGEETARAIMDQGITFEEYLALRPALGG